MQSPPDHEDEVKFAKALVNPEKESRDKTLAKLHKYVASIKSFDDMEMLKLWKALYYTMWLSDKAPIQLELAQNLTNLTQVFSTVELQLLYVRMFFRILMREWFHLDQYRVNKFYSLIRLMFRNVLATAAKAGWASETTAQLIEVVDTEVLMKKPNGVRFHIADIFLSELHTVTSGKIATKDFLTVFRPFLDSVLRLDDNNVYIERVYKEVLHKYASTYAAEHADAEESTTVFPGVNTKVLQKVVFDLASEEETPNVCRKKLYDLHKAFATTTKQQFVSESVEALLAADATHIKGAVAAAAKKDKKKTAVVPESEPMKVVEAVKETKKEKKSDKAEKKAEKVEKAAPVAEKAPVAVEGAKEKNKRSASELAEEAEPVPAAAVKKEKDAEGKKVKTPKAEKTEEAVSLKAEKAEKSDKGDKSDKPKEKKAKTEAKDGEKVVKAEKVEKKEAAEAPKADTPPPQYIASAKFAGRKVGYAFKKVSITVFLFSH